MQPDALARLEQTHEVRQRLADRILDVLQGDDERQTSIPGLTIIQRTQPVPATPYVYVPSFAMIMQGRKNVLIGNASHHYDESLFFLTAASLPTITEVVRASPEQPYVSVLLNLDLDLVREIVAKVDIEGTARHGNPAQAFGPADLPLFEAMDRLVTAALSPQASPFLADLATRELLYRLLTGSSGARLRLTADAAASGNRAESAVAWLREHYTRPLRIAELAMHCDMAESTLHQRFRALTLMSPLQYQKQLRLHEARRLLLTDGIDAGTAAIRVGYESVSQFNREYKRAFGAPPRRDIVGMKGHAR